MRDNRAQRQAPVRGRGRPVGDHDARRADLLDAAGRVVYREGFVGLTMRKIALAAGCSTGTVTYYFADKEEVIMALAEKTFDDWPVGIEVSPDVDQFVGKMIWAMFGMTQQAMAVWFHLVVRAGHDPQLGDLMRRRYRLFRSALRKGLRNGQECGQVRTDVEVGLLAEQLCTMIDGWLMTAPFERRKRSRCHQAPFIAITSKMLKG